MINFPIFELRKKGVNEPKHNPRLELNKNRVKQELKINTSTNRHKGYTGMVRERGREREREGEER